MRDHTSLVVWQRARAVELNTLGLCRTAWRPYAQAIFEQLSRSALSVQLNIAEGYALRGTRRTRNHLRIALGSVVETIDLLALLRDSQIGSPEVIAETIGLAVEARAILLTLIKRENPF